MDGTFVNALLGARAVPQVIDNRIFLPAGNGAFKEAARAVQDSVDALDVSSLTAIRDYLDANIDRLENDKLMLHVVSPTRVFLCGRLEDEEVRFRRLCYLRCTHSVDGFQFGSGMGIESFVINLQTCFVDSPERVDVLRIVSSIKDVTEIAADDDGISQEVTVKTGAVLVQRAPIKNPVILAPFRTFNEVDQVASPFILRVKQVKDQLPHVALFECDGGAWKNEAVERIVAWLRRKCQGVAVIG